MKSTFLADVKTAVNLFGYMQKARKEGKEVKIEKTIQLPFISCSGFYSTVEGCALSHLDKEIVDIAQKTFNNLAEKERYPFLSSPEYGEFVERLKFWKTLLEPVMSAKQCHIAMNRIIECYIHIKRMRLEKGKFDTEIISNFEK